MTHSHRLRPGRSPHLIAVLTTTLTLVFSLTATAAGASSSSKDAQAKKGLLKLSDLPKGWASSGSVSYGNGPTIPGEVQLAHCLGVPTSVVTDNPPTANSPAFNSKNGLELVSDSVSVYPSAHEAKASHDALVISKAPSCLSAEFNGPANSLLQKSFGDGGTVGHLLVTRTQSANYAAHTANYTMFFPVTIHETPINVEAITVDFVQGNEEQSVTLIDFGGNFPVATSRQLTKVADSRI